jgi:aldose sugar dehydrogenase
MYFIFISLSIFFLFCLYLLTYISESSIHGQNLTISAPSLSDSNLRVELVLRNLDFPTGIDFLGKDEFLLSEKDTGNVYRIFNRNVTGHLSILM